MKAILICGSPRKGGNTEQLLTRCMEGLKKGGIHAEILLLSEKKIRPCTACCGCRKTMDKTCVIKSDDFNGMLQQILEADIVVAGSPVYFGSATPEIMSLLDRAGYVSKANGGLLSRKLGGPIVVARRAGQNFTFAQLLFWFMINDMIVPGSTYWNIAFGREAGEAQKDEEGLKTVDRFTENLIWLAQKIHG
ncbi:MAG: flavodoxin family protein [Verrucomicrobiae bacterium]|nr:flavodoxin family protein [Verrucomicrobiae bacterium]